MIHNKDAIDFLDSLQSNSVQMLFADLPYGCTNAKWDTPIDLAKFWPAARKCLTDTGVIVATATMPFSATLCMSNLKDFKYDWVWEKTQGTGHLNAEIRPMSCHEQVLIFSPNKHLFKPIKTTGHERKVSTAHHKRNTNTGELYRECSNFSDYDSTERYPRSVQVFKSDKQKLNLHSTQKPLALLEYLVKTYTNENDLIVDATCGSGGILIAADNLSRRCEINDKGAVWVEIATRRREEHWDANPPKNLKTILTDIHDRHRNNH